MGDNGDDWSVLYVLRYVSPKEVKFVIFSFPLNGCNIKSLPQDVLRVTRMGPHSYCFIQSSDITLNTDNNESFLFNL